MELHNLKSTKNSREEKTRKGRGISQGKGKTSGRGQKGQKSRSNGGVRPGFEGGQTPLYRRIPKRGFTSVTKNNKYIPVNLDIIEQNYKANEVVSLKTLQEKGIIKKSTKNVKILGNGKVSKALTFEIKKVSASALKKIHAIKGKVKVK